MTRLCIATMIFLAGSSFGQGTLAKHVPRTIGGEPVATLNRPLPRNSSNPQFVQLTLLPGRGMAWLQLRAYLPGKGQFDLLNSPSVTEAEQLLDHKDDEFGTGIFRIGGAILLPYANRVRGTLNPDGKTITATVAGRKTVLPANWHGSKQGAELHAIHGLMLKSRFEEIKSSNEGDASTVTGVLHAGNFDGHWMSSTDVTVESTLKNESAELRVTAKNVGNEPEPIGIGWHPYFVIPSGDRKQARLHIPSTTRAVMNNYDDSFITGQRVPVVGTPYDFSAPGGRELGDQYLDDNFSALERRPDGSTVTEIVDPAGNYGLRIVTLSSDIRTIQVYAPPAKNFVAIEPQFNFPDPYNPSWGKLNTGMVVLKPGQSATWRVRLELFVPNATASH